MRYIICINAFVTDGINNNSYEILIRYFVTGGKIFVFKI